MTFDNEIFHAFHNERGALRNQFREHGYGFGAATFVLVWLIECSRTIHNAPKERKNVLLSVFTSTMIKVVNKLTSSVEYKAMAIDHTRFL